MTNRKWQSSEVARAGMRTLQSHADAESSEVSCVGGRGLPRQDTSFKGPRAEEIKSPSVSQKMADFDA